MNPLTPRELEILQAVAAGYTFPRILRQFNIKDPTLRTHLAAIYRKLGAVNRPHAVALAYQQGVLGVDDREVG